MNIKPTKLLLLGIAALALLVLPRRSSSKHNNPNNTAKKSLSAD